MHVIQVIDEFILKYSAYMACFCVGVLVGLLYYMRRRPGDFWERVEEDPDQEILIEEIDHEIGGISNETT